MPYTPNGNEYRHLLLEQRQVVCKDLKQLVTEDPVSHSAYMFYMEINELLQDYCS